MASFTMETLSTDTRGMMVVSGDKDDTYGMSYTTAQQGKKRKQREHELVNTLRH